MQIASIGIDLGAAVALTKRTVQDADYTVRATPASTQRPQGRLAQY